MGIKMLREQASGLTRDQRNAFLAAWLGWAMDAFDYFLLVFVITDVAKDFGTSKTEVAVATTLTLAARPVGAALFGYWADKRGRRTPLLVDVAFYSAVEFLTGFSDLADHAAGAAHAVRSSSRPSCAASCSWSCSWARSTS